jgi:hypothetical protein
LKKYKLLASDENPAELIQVGGETLWCEIHKAMNSVWSKEELTDQWEESIIILVYKKAIKLIVGVIVGYQCYQFHTKFYLISISQG